MSDGVETSVYDFRKIWAAVPNRNEAESVDTLVTIGHAAGGPTNSADLPRVDHLMALGELLGVGGNGEVVAAMQASLHRTIAVKRPRAGSDAGDRLLREARVIGFLEHPNIPPVHFVGADARAELLVGLKRIEGETLTARLQREHPLENLDENLDILIHICNAVGYAHSRGILHLDLKPDNVMTGHFGEVYVLDWGLAAAYREDVTSEISRVGADRSVRGTPAFLAPEMITAQDLSPATDVYLLGGLLHYILTHEPPNQGDSALAAMQNAYECNVRAFDDRIPAALAAICARALAHDPNDRHPDADRFRAAIANYRRERRELEAFANAQTQLAQLDHALSNSPEDTALVYQAYGAARQAIDEAERLRSADDDGRAMLQSVLAPMIRWEIGRENAGGAEVLLSELPTTDPVLASAVEDLRRERVNARAELHAFRHDFDRHVGTTAKVLMAMGVGVLVAAVEVIPYAMRIPATAERVLGGYALYLGGLVILTLVTRRSMFQNRVNRGLMLAILQFSLFGLALRIGAFMELMSVQTAIAYDLTLVSLGALYAGVAFDRRVLVAAPFYILAAMVAFAAPPLAMVTFGTSHLVALTAISIAVVYGSTRATS